MSHGGGGEDGGDPNRWLVSYADFITLLMVLFVIMWAMGRTDIEKYKQLADALQAAFSVGGGGGGASRAIDSGLNEGGGGGNASEGVPDPIVIPGIPKKPPASVDIAAQISDLLSAHDLEGGISVNTKVNGTLISLSEKLVFTPGTTELQQDAYSVLDTIVEMLMSVDNAVRIVGHTDDSSPIDPQYNSNWDLAFARAQVISDYLIQAGISPSRIMIAGRGEYEPIFPNDSDEHRLLNSRVDIVILYEIESNIISGDSPLSIPGLVP